MLASASPARLATLRAAGLDPQVLVSEVDEDAVLAATATRAPSELVAVLARAKARDVAGRAASGDISDGGSSDGGTTLVLGCDSMLELDGALLGKPGDAETARVRWKQMSGRSGVLHTGHHLIDLADGRAGRRAVAVTSSTVVHFASLDDAEIDAYVATGEPLAVAGAFTVDSLGSAFVTGIEGDHHGVVGVSVPLLRTMVRELGHSWTDLWVRDR